MNKILKKLIVVIIGLIILIILMLTIIIIFLLFSLKPTTNIKSYATCLESIQNKQNIAHFPKEIPDLAENIHFYYYDSSSSELLMLEFKIKQDYIENELKNNNFLNPQTKPGTVQNIYNIPTKLIGIDSKDLTYYTLKNGQNFNENERYFPYFSGIGINKDKNSILYYYINPD